MLLPACTLWLLSLGSVPAPFPALANAPVAIQKKRPTPEKYEPFRGTLAEARTAARERNVPLLVCMTLEGEEASDRYDGAIIADSGFRGRATRAVVIISNDATHSTRKVTKLVDGEKVTSEVCSRYIEGTCEDHRRTWDDLYFAYAPDGELRLPETLVIDPNLPIGLETANTQVVWRFAEGDVPSIKAITGALDRLAKKLGHGLTRAQHAILTAHLDRGRIMAKAKSWPDAWRAWRAILAVTTDGPFAEEASAEVPVVEASLRADIEGLMERLKPGEVAIPYGRLLELEKECADLPIIKVITGQLRKVRRRKDIRDDIERFELEREAEKLWAEATDWESKGEPRKAERIAKKLFKKKYAGTPAFERARDRWPDWAPQVN